MRLRTRDGYYDYDLELFREVIRPLDRAVEHYLATDGETANMLDYGISVEHCLGLGLVAAQGYLTSVIAFYGLERRAALAMGPIHSCGIAFSCLINHGANYWKHADEWDYGSPDRRQQAILEALSALGVAEDSNVLHSLVGALTPSGRPSLQGLVPMLEAWHTCVEAEAAEQSVPR